jgi:hypothetical protein
MEELIYVSIKIADLNEAYSTFFKAKGHRCTQNPDGKNKSNCHYLPWAK